jgi:predicted DNA-binding ribbon-helix-helix protein
MKSTIVKRSIVLGGHKTSISLEDAFWNALREIAEMQKMPLSALVQEIDTTRGANNLSSAVRQFVLGQYLKLSKRNQPGAVEAPERDVA